MYTNSKVSIITPSYNSANTIKETYNSIRKQTYNNWEWLVTDDCSVDNTWDILKKIAGDDDRVKLFRNKVNSGAAVSRNESLKNAKGKFIAFIDSDDLWMPTKLENQIKFMGEDIGFSFTAYEIVNHFGKSISRKVDSEQIGHFTYEDMLRKKATIGCSTVMLRRSYFCDVSMPLIRTGQDYALWLKLLKTGVNAYVLNSVLTKYRVLPNSISRNKFKKAVRQWQIYRECEELSLFKTINCFAFYAWRAIFKK